MLTQVSRKSKLAEAIQSGLSRWNGLSAFLDDGRVEIDSRTVARAIRPIALSRKNALFAGSKRWATVAGQGHAAQTGGALHLIIDLD